MNPQEAARYILDDRNKARQKRDQAEKGARIELPDSNQRLKEIDEEEKGIKASEQYKSAMKEFKSVKEDLGLDELGKEKKEIRKEIGEAARDNEPAITLKERTGRMLQEAEKLQQGADGRNERLLPTISEG